MPVLELLSQSTAKMAIAAAGEHLAAALVAADIRRRNYSGPRLAIPGGSAAAAMGAALRVLPERVRRRLHLTWVDERCVPTADEASNYGSARRAGLVPDDAAFVQPLWWDGADPAAVQARMDRVLPERFSDGLDVVLLGLGEDGHIASLFPGHAAVRSPWEFAPDASVGHVTDAPKPPASRMTLKLGTIGRAGLAVLLALGEGKRAALTRVLCGDAGLPTVRVDRLIVVTDLELEIPT
jgi:6-phosphogluconolactonase